MTINAGNGIVVEYHKTKSFDASLEQLSQSPGLSWIDELRSDPDVDWVSVDAAFNKWDYKEQGLSQAGAALLSLAVGAMTSGMISGYAGNLAQRLGFVQGGAMQTAIQSGLNMLTQQAAVALVNNQGDIGAALKELGSSAFLKSLATSMISAGLTTQLTKAAGIGEDLAKTAPLSDRVAQDLRRGLIRASVRAGVSTAIQGGEFGASFVAALRMEASDVLGENLAQEIGTAVEIGDLDTAGQLIAHAALGCAVGYIGSGECASGAAGGVIGETVGLITQSRIEAWVNERALDVLTEKISLDQLLEELNEMQSKGVDIAKLVSGLTVAVAGGDVDVAAQTGANAAENNALCGGICIGTLVLITAYVTWQGDGNPLDGLADIGTGDHPLAHALAAVSANAVEWSAKEYPEATEAFLGTLDALDGAIDATITYVDDQTGKFVSKRWNDIDEHTRNQLKGGAKIAAIFVPGASIKALKHLKHKKNTTKGSSVTTDFLANVTVVHHGNMIAEGVTVDLRGTIAGIKSGKLKPREYYRNDKDKLPVKPDDKEYYLEFTHPTPDIFKQKGIIKGDGPERIVQGKNGELYYTSDHYDTFTPLNSYPFN